MLSSFPGAPVMFLDADNVDGFDNQLLSHAATVGSWKTQGSLGLANFTAVGPSDTTRVRASPYLRKTEAETAVAFDGVFDQLQCAGSASALKFIHETGVFDLFLVLRRNAGGNPRRIIGGSGGSSQRGLQVLYGDLTDSLSVTLGNSTGLVVSFDSTMKLAIGEPSFLLIRGTGSKIQITKDLYYWQEQDFTDALGTGNAFNDYCLGSYKATALTPELFEGDMFILGLYDSNNSPANCLAFKTAAEEELGGAL